MNSFFFHLITATFNVCTTFAEEYGHIDIVVIPGDSFNTNVCPSVKKRAEVFQWIESNVTAIIYDNREIQDHCGVGSWYQVAHLNMTNSSEQCPAAWREYNTNGVRACGRVDTGCQGTFYPTGHQYSKVCGRVIGYQVASPGAFHIFQSPHSINDIYVDGVSVTHGSPRSHIWTLAAGVTEGKHIHPQADCPCAISDPSSRQPAPNFIGNNYYCESGNSDPAGDWIAAHLYTDDPLWDGQKCEGHCCSNGKSPPWFSVELQGSTSDDIEVRICGDQDLNDEDNPIALMELFVQ